MDIEGLYQELRRIQARGEIGNAYGGCGTVEEESNVLVDFFECIMEKYKDSMPLWAEAFIQIFDWQFQTFHEDAEMLTKKIREGKITDLTGYPAEWNQ